MVIVANSKEEAKEFFKTIIIELLEKKTEKEYLTAEETAAFLGKKIGTIYNMSSDGRLKKHFLEGSATPYFKKSELFGNKGAAGFDNMEVR